MANIQNNITIRKATPKDAETIADILYQAFISIRSLYTLEAFNATVIPASKVIERIKEGVVWLALYEGEAVGTVSTIEKKEGLYIRGMAVLPKARGLTIGWHLLENIEKEAAGKGYERLLLSTTPFLYSAIELYKNFGFTKGSKEEFFGTDLFSWKKLLPDLS